MFFFSVLPLKMALLLAEYMGTFKVMDGFLGQKKKG